MIKLFLKPTSRWTWTAVVIFIILGLLGFTNLISNGTFAKTSISEANMDKQTAPVIPVSTEPNRSFDYHNYLPFTPLLPSYTAGYKLTYSKIERSLNNPLGNTIVYTARYGTLGSSISMFEIMEARPDEFHLVTEPATKTPIQIGNVQAMMEKHNGGGSIQFTKNDVEYYVSSPGNITLGVSLDVELKKICESITVPLDTPPTEINISDTGLSALSGLSFKAIHPGDFIIPQGYKFQGISTNIHVNGVKKVELLTITYKNGTSYLSVFENNEIFTEILHEILILTKN